MLMQCEDGTEQMIVIRAFLRLPPLQSGT
jgi:hypothetical protein